jgi:predicted DNA-binding protein
VRRAAYYVDVDLLERLDSYCRVTEANKSEVVREALEAYLADHSLR